MTKLPVLEGNEIIKALAKIGYRQVRQKGSHIRLQCIGRKSVTVPDHTVGREILRDANLSLDEFSRLLE
ncbi:MAG TPA: type II toxin-antitoxin system HicA family toxin [Ignavibacteriaceae bacterium]|nr:type II toxin-antitoxin system HicA family toxin [Ignavibacteriaceae bacterium]